MEIHVKITGLLLMVVAIVHVIFPRYFKWTSELSALSLINRQMMYVHTFFIALVVFLMGLLCFTSSNELVEPGLGQKITLGLAVFWGCRLVIQFVGYSSKLWKGKLFETSVHIFFLIVWTYVSAVFIWTSLT
jgi:hypothetical protein